MTARAPTTSCLLFLFGTLTGSAARASDVGRRSLVTTDHKMRPDHAHRFLSPDGKRILFQSGLLSGGTSLDVMVITIPQWMQNRRWTVRETGRNPLNG